MKEIQLSEQLIFRIFWSKEKHNCICKKLNTFMFLILLITLGLFIVFFSSDRNQNNNFNISSSIIKSDTTQNNIKVSPNYLESELLVKYGTLLKEVEKKQEEKKYLAVSIESLKERQMELLIKKCLKENKGDSLNNQIVDSISLKIDGIKKVNEQKANQIEIDSITKKIIDINEDIKKIEEEIKKLNHKIVDVKYSLEKESTSFIDNIISKSNGQEVFNFKGIKYYIFAIDLNSKSNQINFHLKNKEGKNYGNILSLLNDKNLDSLDFLMITNAGMYTPNHEPQGLFIENGKMIKPLDETNANNNTNFYLFPNGVFYVDSNNNANIKTTIEYSKMSKMLNIKHATQSGPMLVINNKIHEKFVQGSKNINIRSGVGIIDNKKLIFLISDGYVNFWDFATVFKDVFGCNNALYLDGAVSLMYLKNIKPNVIGGNFGPLISITKKKQ